jgi:hypothetical protein
MHRVSLLAALVLGAVVVSPHARSAEPWADPKLPVTDGLELWLDATRIDAATKAAKEKLPPDGKLAAWPDASGKGRHVRQPAGSARPTLIRTGGTPVVRFDGDDDHLRLAGQSGELRAFTVFVVAIQPVDRFNDLVWPGADMAK